MATIVHGEIVEDVVIVDGEAHVERLAVPVDAFDTSNEPDAPDDTAAQQAATLDGGMPYWGVG